MGGSSFNPFSSISNAIKDPFSTDTISAMGMHMASGGVVNGATDNLFNLGANALGVPNTGDLYGDPLLALDPGGLVYQSKDPDVLAKQAKYGHKIMRYGVKIFIVSLILVTVIPNKQTILIYIAGSTALNTLHSETGQKAITALNVELDKFIKENK